MFFVDKGVLVINFPLSTAFPASHVPVGCDFVFIHLIFISLVISFDLLVVYVV